MRKFTNIAAATGIVLTLTAPAALAADFTGSRTGSHAEGKVTVVTKAVVSGTVWDTKADGKCARLRGNWDIPLRPDHGFEVAEACGNGQESYGYEGETLDRRARDFEVRVYTGDDHKVIWEGTRTG